MHWWTVDEPFYVDTEDRYVLVKLPGVYCTNFARELANMEHAMERFAFPRLPVSEALAESVPGHIWAAVWNEVGSSISLSNLADGETG